MNNYISSLLIQKSFNMRVADVGSWLIFNNDQMRMFLNCNKYIHLEGKVYLPNKTIKKKAFEDCRQKHLYTF